MRILVVEDEASVALVLRRALEALGNACYVAHSAAEAERLLDQEDVDGVTLDLGLPDRSGLDWLESVAETRPELARRTLVITAMDMESESASRLARCGAGMLAKPFTLQSLSEAWHTQVDRPDCTAPRTDS